VVWGRRAGAGAAAYARAEGSRRELPADPAAGAAALLQQLLGPEGTERSAPIRAALQRTMDADASAIRSEESLARAAADIGELRKRYANVAVTDTGRRYNTDLIDAVELGFLLDIADVMISSAAARKESRGAHFRADYPARDDAGFLHHTLAYRSGPPDAPVQLGARPVDVSRHQATERRY
jgi:succinate dehydrogenase / fumarate reductase flavoprotein subunit